MSPIATETVTIRRVVLATLVVVAVALCFLFLLRFYPLLLILFAAVIISIAIEPLVSRLHRHGVDRANGVLLVYGLLGLLLIAFVWFVVPLIVRQAAFISASVAEGYLSLRQAMLDTPSLLLRRISMELPSQLPLSLNTAVPPAEQETAATVNQVWQVIERIGLGVLGVIAALFFAFYWTLEGERLKRVALLLLPLRRREAARTLLAEIEERVGRYVVGQATLCLIIGALAFVVYLLLGLPYALVLALFAGIMEAVPLVGPIAGAIPAVVIAFSISPLTAVWVVVATAVIQQLEGNLLVPRVMNRAVGVRPLVTVLALIAFGSLFGVAGALVAIPLAGIFQLLLDRYLHDVDNVEAVSSNGRDRVSVLRYKTQDLIHDVRHQIRSKDEAVTPESDQVEDAIESIALDLDSLLARYGPPEDGR